MNYYGRFFRSKVHSLLKRINGYLVRWARNKYRRLASFKRVKKWWTLLSSATAVSSCTDNGQALSNGSNDKKPCESRDSRTDLWEPRCEIPRATRLGAYEEKHSDDEPPRELSERAQLRKSSGKMRRRSWMVRPPRSSIWA
jgi:hypothetical protein